MADENDDTKQLSSDTPSDVLRSHVDNHIQLPHENKFDDVPLMKEVTSHPNLQAPAIEKLYSHLMAPVSAESKSHETGDSEPYNYDLTENIMHHPNTSTNLKKDFASKTFSPDNPQSDLHAEVADSGVVDEGDLRRMAGKVLESGSVPHEYSHISPDYYLHMFKNHSATDPEGMDSDHSRKRSREMNYALRGVGKSVKHTPETLDQAIAAVTGARYGSSDNTDEIHDNLSSLVSERKDLSKDQLNRIHQWLDSNDGGDHAYASIQGVREVLSHKNVDPSLLARYAVGKKAEEAALEHPNLPKESMNAAVRRVRSPEDYGDVGIVRAVLKNPSITKTQVASLVKKGFPEALKHELADPNSVREAWNRSDKSAETARSFLETKNLPTDVLKEIVNHKNQGVAVEALNHQNADLDVVQEGLKRKAKNVQDAARLHPLVATSQVKEGLKSGSTSLSKAYEDEDFKSHFDRLPRVDQEAVFAKANEKYQGQSIGDIAKKTKESVPQVVASKSALASDTRVPESIRKVHAKDLSDYFEDNIPKNSSLAAIADRDDDSESGLVFKSVYSLAHQGDKSAQKVLLGNPSALMAVADKSSFGQMPPEFLENVLEARKKYIRDGADVYDRWGSPMKFDSNGLVLRRAFESENLPEKAFFSVATDGDLMNRMSPGDYFKRYDDLPPDQQNQKYQEILNSGSPVAAESVLESKAPPESWDRAFAMIGDKREFLRNNIRHVKEHRPDVFKNAVLGRYNEPGEEQRGYHKNYQIEALNHLDPNVLEDRETLKRLIAMPEDDIGHLPGDSIVGAAPKQMYDRDYSMIDYASSLGRTGLSYDMLANKVKSDLNEADEDKNRLFQLMPEYDQKIRSMPSIEDEGSDNLDASRWLSFLKADSEYGLHYFARSRGINMDFLADMPGIAGEELRQEALKKNLISPEKIQEIASSHSVGDILSIGDRTARQKAVDAFVASGDADHDSLATLANGISQNLLNPEAVKSRRASMSQEAYETYQSRLNNLIDLYSQKAPDLVMNLLRRATQAKSGDALTQADLGKIVRGTMTHIGGSVYSDPHAKNQAMYRAWDAFKNLDYSGQASALKQIEKSALDSSDYETLTQMASDGTLSNSGVTALARAAEQPGVLSASQLASLSFRMDTNSSLQSLQEMAKTFDIKVAEESASGASLAADKQRFVNNVVHAMDPSNQDKSQFVLNYVRRAATDPETSDVANRNLYDMSKALSEYDPETSVKVYEQLPNDLDMSPKQWSGGFSEDVVNDPRFVQASSTGWKLKVLSNQADRLTGANVSVLVNRALLPESNFGVSLPRLFSNLESNHFVSPEDSVKLARSMSSKEFRDALKTVGSPLEGNAMYAARARLGDLDESVQREAKTRSDVLSDLYDIAELIGNSKIEESIPNLSDKLGKASEILSEVHARVSAAADEMIREAEKGASPQFSKDHNQIIAIAQKISSSELGLSKGEAFKVMDMVEKFHAVGRAAGSEDQEGQSFKTIQNVVGNVEDFEEQDWKDVFQKVPHAAMFLSSRSSIPSAALNAANYDSFAAQATNKDESRQNTQFVKESTQWFSKMSDADLHTHGKKLLNHYVRMISDDTAQIFHNDYVRGVEEAFKYLGSKVSYDELKSLMSKNNDHGRSQHLFRIAVENGAGGEHGVKEYARQFESIFRSPEGMGSWDSDNVRHQLEPVVKSLYLDEELADKVHGMFKINKAAMSGAVSEMLSNAAAPASVVGKFVKDVIENHEGGYQGMNERQSAAMASKLMQHPNISESALGKMFEITNESFPKQFTPNGKFNPALTNPTYGGKLFRAIPRTVPESVKKHVDESRLVDSVRMQGRDYQKMTEVMGLIPAEGMSWAEFKKRHPDQEKSLPQSVKNVFTSAQNKPVLPEQFAKAARDLDDNSKKYHLTYSEWSSDLQRHRPMGTPNMVVQINNSEESERELSKDPKLWGLYQHLLLQANGIRDGSIGLHLTTPHLVSWSRVDVDQGGSSWAIEEYQSDFAQKFRKNLKSLMANFPSGAQIGGRTVTQDEMKKYSKAIDKHLSDWSEASMQAVIENAKKAGVTKLYMHGAEMRGYMSSSQYSREYWDNPNTKPFTVGFRKIYDENPRSYGFQECDYTDYPKHSPEMLNNLKKAKLSTKCWVLDLNPAPKKRRRP